MRVSAGRDKQSPNPLLLKNACSARGRQRRVDPPAVVWCPNPFPLCPPLSFGFCSPLFCAWPYPPFLPHPSPLPPSCRNADAKRGVCATFLLLIAHKGRGARVNG